MLDPRKGGLSGTYPRDMRVSRSYPGTDQIVRFWWPCCEPTYVLQRSPAQTQGCLSKESWRPWEVLYPCSWHVGLALTSTRTRRWWWAATTSAKRLRILRSTSRTAAAAYPCSGGQKKAGARWASAVIFSPTTLLTRNRTEEKSQPSKSQRNLGNSKNVVSNFGKKCEATSLVGLAEATLTSPTSTDEASITIHHL